MELINELTKYEDSSEQGLAVMKEATESIVLLLAPIVPHITQQLWQDLGHSGLVAEASWPDYDEAALVKDEVELVVQVNGKLRSKIMVQTNADKEFIETMALQDEKIISNIADKTVRKVVVVPGRLVNLVVS